MNINGKTKVCGLIGNPVEHTLSPFIHMFLAKETGINLVYVPFLVKNDLSSALTGAYELNIQGLNITVPYKEQAYHLLTRIDSLAEKIGAVNTLVREEDGFYGYNTDLTGLYRAMKSEGIEIEGEKIIVLGAGGAARAAVYLCDHYGAKEIYVMNRNKEKANLLAEQVNTKGKGRAVPLSLKEIHMLPEEKMTCIQATSVGLAPHLDQTVVEETSFYERIHTGYDLIYRPSTTRFMQLVRDHRGRAYHGLKMLLYQAVEAFELWNNIKIEEELCLKAYEMLKGEMGIEE